MTELEVLARECIENHTHKLIDNPTKQDIYIREESIYISGYKECERRNNNHIVKLETLIEKMKCCENCKYKSIGWNYSVICGFENGPKIENPLTCKCEKMGDEGMKINTILKLVCWILILIAAGLYGWFVL